MKCWQIESKLDDLIDRSISEEESKLILGHLENCSKCRTEFEDSTVLKELLSQYGNNISVPVESYFSNVTELILARTVNRDNFKDKKAVNLSKKYSNKEKYSFYRSLFSAVASIAILFSSLMLGSQTDTDKITLLKTDQPIFISANLEKISQDKHGVVISDTDQLRIAKASTLIGSPGLFGRTSLSILQFEMEY